jgi:hypothetical protein
MNANKKALEAKTKEQERINAGDKEEESSSSSSSEEEETSEDEAEHGKESDRKLSAKEPRMHAAMIPHYGGVNRIKVYWFIYFKMEKIFINSSATALGPAMFAPFGTINKKCKFGI